MQKTAIFLAFIIICYNITLYNVLSNNCIWRDFMLKFQEESLRQSVNGALALRHQINPFLDAIFEKVLQTYVF